MTITRHEFVERVERAVLAALDTVVQDAFGQEYSGWTDNEIPSLAPTIHSHAKRAYQRLTLHEPERSDEQ